MVATLLAIVLRTLCLLVATLSLADFSGTGRAWWPLQDTSGDAVALVESGFDPQQPSAVRVAGNWTFNAYGQCLSALHDLTGDAEPFPRRTVGHKGLFVDRLDGRTEHDGAGGSLLHPPSLVPLSAQVCHAGNRAYLPSIGRWLQRDPNATAQTLAGVSAGGAAFGASVAEFDLDTLFTDGPNFYGYLRGNPRLLFDPSGLMLDMFIPGPSDLIGGALSGLFEEYSSRMEWDAEWAGDWSQDDGWSTQGDSSDWIYWAMLQGVYDSFDIDIPFTDTSINPLDFLMAGGSRTIIYPGGEDGYRNVMAKGIQEHHIATNKGTKANDFKRIFDRANMSLDCDENKIRIPHSGRHNRAYHDWVHDRLTAAVGDSKGAPAAVKLKKELNMIGEFLEANPHFVYDTSRGRSTGFRGMRGFNIMDEASGSQIQRKKRKRR